MRFAELAIRQVEWRGNAPKRLRWYSDWRENLQLFSCQQLGEVGREWP